MDEPTIPEFLHGGYRESFIARMRIKFPDYLIQDSSCFIKNFVTGKIIRDDATFKDGMYNCLLANTDFTVDRFFSSHGSKQCYKHVTREMVKQSWLDYVQEFKQYYLKIYRLFDVRTENDKVRELEEEIKQIKERGEQRITELEKENQELKDLVYSSLDQIHDLKENKSYFAEELQIMKISFDDSLRELEDESLENLGQQIINILDKFNELNEHNKSLSSRVLDVECLLEINTINLKCLLEKKEIPNLIDF